MIWSNSSMIAAPESTGSASRPRMAVMNSDHTDSGMRNQVMPGARLLMIVVMWLSEPRIEDRPTRMIETDHSSWPNEAPERSCRADRGAYIVHPARAAPSGTNRLDNITRPAAKNDQNDHMLMRGNAMSCVPILSGIRKLAYTPTS